MESSWGVREMGRCWPKGTNLQLSRMNKSKELMHSRMIIVSNSVLNTRNMLRVDFRCSHHIIMVTR